MLHILTLRIWSLTPRTPYEIGLLCAIQERISFLSPVRSFHPLSLSPSTSSQDHCHCVLFLVLIVFLQLPQPSNHHHSNDRRLRSFPTGTGVETLITSPSIDSPLCLANNHFSPSCRSIDLSSFTRAFLLSYPRTFCHFFEPVI